MTETTHTTRVITSIDEFRSCRSRWNELAGSRVFHRWEWMFSWWEAFQELGQLSIVVVIDSRGQWLGVAPWYQSHSVSRGVELRQLADGAACSDYVSLAVRSGYETVVADSIANELAIQSKNGGPLANVDWVELEGHLQDDLQITRLTEAIGRDWGRTETNELSGTWRADLPQSWAEYEARLHKSFRRKTRKASKRLDSDEFDPAVYFSPSEIDANWHTFVDLHQRRRQSLEQPGCFADQRFERFLRSATLRLAEHSLAQLNVIRYLGKPLATHLEFVAGDSICIYQTGLDPEQIDLEPGHITFTWAFQQAIEKQFRWLDFLRGDEPYKSRWKAQRLPLFRTRMVPRRFKSILRNGLVNAAEQAKGWTKSFMDSKT